MKSIWILFLTLIFASAALAEGKKVLTQEEFEQKRWNDIKALIDQEMSTIKRARNQSLRLKYRMFELKSELLKLYKEKENKEFMQQKQKYGRKVSRKKVFKRTLKLYKEAHETGHRLLRNYPNSRYKASIYYTLAINSRDFSYDNKQLGYLKKAIKFSNATNKVNYLARTSLAEYYYNNKNWKAAVYQYNIVLKNQDDEWYTKNLLNYGWCQLKNHKFNVAINSLEKSHKLSEDEYYVDVRDQVMTGLINFYVYGKQIERGIKFIDKNALDKQESLLNLAKKAANKGYYKETEKIVSDLEGRIDAKKRPELFADLRLFQFDVYKQYHKPNKLVAIAKLFPKTKFNDFQREDAVRKISDLVGAKQIILKKDFSKQDKMFDRSILRQIVTYFDILSAINPVEKAQYEYFKAETYFSVHQFKPALATYKSSLAIYDKTPSKKDLRKLNMDAIFSSINNLKLSKKDQANELEFAYNKYLSYWPKDKKAQEIFPRLFALYATRKDYKNMQKSLDRYVASFPKDRVKQQELFRAQADMLIKSEKTQLLAEKIKLMRKGYLKFTPKEVKKSETILASILFKKFQKLNEAGKENDALDGYKAIHYTEYYPDAIKAEAAFNMGMIYTDLSDNNNAIKWYQKSFEFYTEKEKNEKRTFLEKMALRTALLHDFIKAARLNTFLLKNFCDQKKANIKIFTQAIKNDLANDYMTKVDNTIDKYKHCVSYFPNSLKKEIMVHLFENRHDSALIDFVSKHKLAAYFPEEVNFYYERIFWKHYNKNPGWQTKMFYQLKKLKDQKSRLLVQTLPLFEQFEKDVVKFKRSKINVATDEKPDKFAQKLQRRLGKIQSLVAKSDFIFNQGHGQLAVLTYDLLAGLTSSLSVEMGSYRLPINDKNFQKQFKTQMSSLVVNFNNQKVKYVQQAQDLIEKYELLVENRQESHQAFDILKISDLRPEASKMAITFGLGN